MSVERAGCGGSLDVQDTANSADKSSERQNSVAVSSTECQQQGWIRLHRKLLDSEVASDLWLTGLWAQLLLRASWHPSNFQGHPIQPGQVVCSYRKLSKSLGIGHNRLREGLNRLAALGQVRIETSKSFTLVTICNWDRYQGVSEPDTPSDEVCPSQTRGVSEPDTGCVQDRHAGVSEPDTFLRSTTSKQGKKGKNKNAREEPVFPPSLDCSEFATAWAEYEQHRKDIGKPLTDLAAKKCLNKLDGFGSLQAALDSIDASIANGWTGVFEPDRPRTNGKATRAQEDEVIRAAMRGAQQQRLLMP